MVESIIFLSCYLGWKLHTAHSSGKHTHQKANTTLAVAWVEHWAPSSCLPPPCLCLSHSCWSCQPLCSPLFPVPHRWAGDRPAPRGLAQTPALCQRLFTTIRIKHSHGREELVRNKLSLLSCCQGTQP